MFTLPERSGGSGRGLWSREHRAGPRAKPDPGENRCQVGKPGGTGSIRAGTGAQRRASGAEGAGEVPASPGWQPDACLLLMKQNMMNY